MVFTLVRKMRRAIEIGQLLLTGAQSLLTIGGARPLAVRN
jgi:hypothetical protein